MELNYGTDPEVFAVVNENGGNFVVSPALFENTGQIKPVVDDLKHPIYIDTDKFSWMMDGVAFELTVKNPLKTPQELYDITRLSLETLEDFMSKLTWNGLKINLYCKPVVNINPFMYLDKIENEKIYQGFIFGCDEDYDAIDTNYKCETIDVISHQFRYGGGHFHISGVEELFELPRPTIQLLAIFLGNYVVSKSLFPEMEKIRSTTYGRPGRFRPQVYKNGAKGIEYRTPSNSWLSLPLKNLEEMFSMSEKAVSLLVNPEKGIKIIKEYLPQTIDAIINTDQNLSQQILEAVC